MFTIVWELAVSLCRQVFSVMNLILNKCSTTLVLCQTRLNLVSYSLKNNNNNYVKILMWIINYLCESKLKCFWPLRTTVSRHYKFIPKIATLFPSRKPLRFEWARKWQELIKEKKTDKLAILPKTIKIILFFFFFFHCGRTGEKLHCLYFLSWETPRLIVVVTKDEGPKSWLGEVDGHTVRN